MALMQNERAREVSFFLNILGAVISGLVLAYIMSFNSKMDETQKKVTEITVDVATIKEVIKHNKQENHRLEQQLNSLDSTQRELMPLLNHFETHIRNSQN